MFTVRFCCAVLFGFFPVMDHESLERARQVRLRLGIEWHARAFATALEAVCQRMGERNHWRQGRRLGPMLS